MKYKDIVFDIDGTLICSEYATLQSLSATIQTLCNKKYELSELEFALSLTSEKALKKIGVSNISEGLFLWNEYFKDYRDSVQIFQNIEKLLSQLKTAGYQLGIITSQNFQEYKNIFLPLGLDHYFDLIIHADSIDQPKPDPEPMMKYIELSGSKTTEIIYIGDSWSDIECARLANVAGGLALWNGKHTRYIKSDYYFFQPDEVYALLSGQDKNPDVWKQQQLASELKFIAQSGQILSPQQRDLERYHRIEEIAKILQDIS